jgi:hypothetical protein
MDGKGHPRSEVGLLISLLIDRLYMYDRVSTRVQLVVSCRHAIAPECGAKAPQQIQMHAASRHHQLGCCLTSQNEDG